MGNCSFKMSLVGLAGGVDVGGGAAGDVVGVGTPPDPPTGPLLPLLGMGAGGDGEIMAGGLTGI